MVTLEPSLAFSIPLVLLSKVSVFFAPSSCSLSFDLNLFLTLADHPHLQCLFLRENKDRGHLYDAVGCNTDKFTDGTKTIDELSS